MPVRFCIAALIFSALFARAGEAQVSLFSKEPLPWNLLENGGFEHEGAGLFAVGDAERDRAQPYSGRSSGMIVLKPGKTELNIRITDGLKLEKGKEYTISGRMRSSIKSLEGEARIDASMSSDGGKTQAVYHTMKQRGTNEWQHFVRRLRGTGTSGLRLTLNFKGMPGDTIWLDELYVGPADVDLQWSASAKEGLFQAVVGDGNQFEFSIPADADVLGVFLNGERLRDTLDFDTLYGARVIRLFEAPKKGDHLAIVLRAVSGFARLQAPGAGVYGVYEKAGSVKAWIPAEIEKFRAPNIDYSVLSLESSRLPSIAGLPAEWPSADGKALRYSTKAPGIYSIRLRDSRGEFVRSLAEHLRLHSGGEVELPFDGRNDAGAPLAVGTYRWEITKRTLRAFSPLRSGNVSGEVKKVWQSAEGWLYLTQEKVEGRSALIVKALDANFKVGDKKTLVHANGFLDFIEAKPNLYFYADAELGQIVKVEGGKAAPFSNIPNFFTSQHRIFLAAYDTAEGPGLYLSRSPKDRDNPPANMPAALFKLDSKGALVPGFGNGGAVSAPTLGCPRAVAVLSNGDVLASDCGAHAVLKRLDQDGKLKAAWRSPRGGPLQTSVRLEDSEEAQSFTEHLAARVSKDFDARYRTVEHLRVHPSGEIFLTTHYENENVREIQIYSPLGEFSAVIGRGPQAGQAANTYDYARQWDTRASDAFSGIASLDFDPQGNLIVLDTRSRQIVYWQTAPVVSNLAMEIKTPAKDELTEKPRVDELPAGYGVAALKQLHGLDARVVDFVDLALDGAGSGFRDDGCSSVIRKTGLRPYRVSGTEQGSWFRTKLMIENPSKPHLLLIEYPDDAHRWTQLSIRHEGEWFQGQQRGSSGANGGYATGWANPLSGKERIFSTLVYPRRNTLTLNFSSALHASLAELKDASGMDPLSPLYGAAASRVWVLEVNDPLGANAVEEPLEGVKRLIGEHRKSIEPILSEFGGPLANHIGRRRTWIDREWAQKAYTNYLNHSAWLGLNSLVFAATDDKGDLSRMVRGAEPKADANAFNEGLALVLDQSKASSMDASVSFMHSPLIPRDRENLKGKFQLLPSGEADAGRLSLLYPEVQQFLMEPVLALANNIKGAPEVKSVTLFLKTGHPPLFGSDHGYEEIALKAFEASTGKTLGDVPLSEKVARLKNELREDWTKWRCSLVLQWALQLRDELKKIRPDLSLVLQLAPESNDARLCGFDPMLYKDQENIRVVEAPDKSENFPGFIEAPVEQKFVSQKFVDGLEFTPITFEQRTHWHGTILGSLVPNKEHILKPLIANLIRNNPRSITFQSHARTTMGAEFELREFIRAFRSLPHAPVEELADAVPEARKESVRVFRFGSGAMRYLAVINTSNEAQTVKISVAHDGGANAVRDLVLARDVAGTVADKTLSFETAVPAFGIRTYRVGK